VSDDGFEVRGRYALDVATEEFLVEGIESGGEDRQLVIACGVKGVLELRFMRGGFGVATVAMLAAPDNESWFGDADLAGDTSEAPAEGTEFDELVFGFESVHSLIF